MLSDTPYRRASIDDVLNETYSADLIAEVPIGSVEFVRAVFKRNQMTEPYWETYPAELTGFLKRAITKTTLADLDWNQTQFIKPAKTKLFTGFVLGGPGVDSPELSTVLTLDKSTEVYSAEVIHLQSESRAYIRNGRILGMSRYDDGPDDAPCANPAVVEEMIQAFGESAPAAYSLDVGVDTSGDTVLIEANDFWALGLYPGGITPQTYFNAAYARWWQIAVMHALRMTDKVATGPLETFLTDGEYEGSLPD